MKQRPPPRGGCALRVRRSQSPWEEELDDRVSVIECQCIHIGRDPDLQRLRGSGGTCHCWSRRRESIEARASRPHEAVGDAWRDGAGARSPDVRCADLAGKHHADRLKCEFTVRGSG
jgi:hypothetical protein